MQISLFHTVFLRLEGTVPDTFFVGATLVVALPPPLE